MKKTLYILRSVMMTAFIVGLLYGCKPNHPVNVLVVHQFDEEMVTYDSFDQTIVDEFNDFGYQPHIINFYMNLEDQAHMDCHKLLAEMSDSLRKLNWKPDIILVEGDRSLRQWHLPANDTILSWRDDAISVYGGIHFNDMRGVSKLKNNYLITDPKNMRLNLELISRMTGSRIVAVELDHYHEDSLIYAQINHQLGKNPYAVQKTPDGYVTGELKPVIYCNDTVSIRFYSAEWNEERVNGQSTTSDSLQADSPMTSVDTNSQTDLDRMYQNAWRYPVLVPKKDVWCEAIASKTHRPQFTTCRELFNDGKGSYLCGYFTGYPTMAHDMVKTAVGAYEGKKVPKHQMHEQNAYMDYMAMERLGMKYNDFKDDFIIVNASTKVTNPLLYSLVTIGNFLWVVLLIVGITLLWLKSHKDSIRNLSAMVDEEREMNQLAIDASGNFYISSLKGIERVLDSMGPDQEACKAEIQQSLNEMGTHTHTYRIRAAMDEEKNMAWWSLRYIVNYNTDTGFSLKGYLLNVNDDVNFAHSMQQIQKIADETKRTEGFLWTMAHEIRTPLNSIVGFCDVIKMMGTEMSESEREQMVQGIESNNQLLEHIVDDIDELSHVVSDEVVYEKQRIEVGALVDELYESSKQRFEQKGLKFYLVKGRGSVHVIADRRRLYDTMYQLVDNALKFTKEGSAAIGWEYNLDTGNVELFVEDSGVGIPEDDLSLIYDMFWKKDTFVPGVGIGLSLAKAYTEAMGGTLTVVSELGIGSRFIVVLKETETA